MALPCQEPILERTSAKSKYHQFRLGVAFSISLIYLLVFRFSDDVNWSDIDLNADYSDSDNEVPIEEKKFWEYFQKLEENNLFEMNLF